MTPLTTKAAEIRAGLVADWRKAMEGVTPGAWTMEVESSDRVDEAGEDRQPEVYVCSSGTQCDFTVVATMGRAESIPHMRKSFDASWIARCSPAGIASLLALIEQQAAELAEARAGTELLAKQIAEIEAEHQADFAKLTTAESERDEARAENASLRRSIGFKALEGHVAEIHALKAERDELLREKERLEREARAGDFIIKDLTGTIKRLTAERNNSDAVNYTAERRAREAMAGLSNAESTNASQSERIAVLEAALRPFADFAQWTDAEGWTSNIHREGISVWFGPSDFRRARSALAPLGEE